MHVQTEQSVICWLRGCWEAMDTKLFVLLPEMFPFPRLKPPQRRHIPDYEARLNRENIHAQTGVVSHEQRFEAIIAYNSQPSSFNE